MCKTYMKIKKEWVECKENKVCKSELTILSKKLINKIFIQKIIKIKSNNIM